VSSEDDLNKLLEDDLDKADSEELFSSLVGRIVINHEQLNSMVGDLVLLLIRDLTPYYFIFSEEKRLFTEMDHSDARMYIQGSAIKAYLRSLQQRLISQNTTTSELRNACIEFMNSFNEICEEQGYPFTLAKDLPTLIRRSLATENTVRNHLVHSTFKFDSGKANLTRVKTARIKRGLKKGKKLALDEEPKFAISDLKHSDFLEFIGFQKNLINVLEWFISDVRDVGYLFLESGSGKTISAEMTTENLKEWFSWFTKIETERQKLKLAQRNELDADFWNFHEYL